MKLDIILNEHTTAQKAAELGKKAEEYGFRAVWSSNYAGMRDPFMVLGNLAQETNKIIMGPLAVSPYELHPVKIAMALQTLNELSNGRAMIGLGAGGGVLPSLKKKPERKIRAMREAMEIMQEYKPNHFINTDGEMYSAMTMCTDWVLEQQPKIYACAGMPQMINISTKMADGLMMSDVTPEMLPNKMPLIQEGLEKHERDKESFSINNFWALHYRPDDKEEAMKEARKELVWRGVLQEEYLEPYIEPDEVKLVREKFNNFRMAFFRGTHIIEGVDDSIVDRLVDGLACVCDDNNIDSFIEKLKTFEEAGLTDFAIRLHVNQEETLKMLGEKVLPEFDRI